VQDTFEAVELDVEHGSGPFAAIHCLPYWRSDSSTAETGQPGAPGVGVWAIATPATSRNARVTPATICSTDLGLSIAGNRQIERVHRCAACHDWAGPLS